MKRSFRKTNIKKGAGLLIVLYIAVILCVVHNIHPFVQALGKRTTEFDIGGEEGNVKAVLTASGTLTLSGRGRTLNYTKDDAPFEEYADLITSVKIEEGITGLGDYLFYNCGNLKGNLTLPSTVIWIGNEAFSGESQERAPKFTMVSSRFTEAEIGLPLGNVEKPTETETGESGTGGSPATPGEAAKGPGETGSNEESGSSGETGNSGETGSSGESGSAEESGSSGESGSPEEGGGSVEGDNSEESGSPGESGSSEESGSSGESGSPEESGNSEESSRPEESSTTGETGHVKEENTAVQNENQTTGGNQTTTEGQMIAGYQATAGNQTINGIQTTAKNQPVTEGYMTTANRPITSSQQPEHTVSTMGKMIKGIGNLVGDVDIEGVSKPEESEKLPEQAPEHESDTSSIPPDTESTADSDETGEEAVTKPESETNSPSTLPASPSDAWSKPEETEPEDEFSDDGMLANDLYENAVATSDIAEEYLDRYHLETITSQILGADLFYPGQSGGYECEETNTAFLDAAEAAGYQRADSTILADMDDGAATAELAVVNGVFYAPDLSEEIVCGDGEDDLFTNEFVGWILDDEWKELGEEAPAYEPGQEIVAPEGKELVKLYSKWEKTCRIEPVAQSQIQEDSVVLYSLVDGNTGESLPIPSGYYFQYQWQLCEDDAESGLSEWSDIEGADGAVYRREFNRGEAAFYFRCAITIQRVTMFRSRSAEEPQMVVSEPVSGTSDLPISITYDGGGASGTAPESVEVQDGKNFTPSVSPFTREDGQVFVGWKMALNGVTATSQEGNDIPDGTVVSPTAPMTLSAQPAVVSPSITLTAQWGTATVIYLKSGGDDSADGLTEATAVGTIGTAYARLPDDGTLETNRIVLCNTYAINGTVNTGAKPATISGTAAGVLSMPASNSILQCQADTTIENLTIQTSYLPSDQNHMSTNGIYAMGHRLTMGYGLNCLDSNTFVYGGVVYGTVEGDTHVTICSGRYRFVYAGGYGDSSSRRSDINGNTYLTVYDGEFCRLYGGSNLGDITKSAHIAFYGGKVDGVWGNSLSIVGGPRNGKVSSDTSVEYSTKVEIYGGTIGKDIAGATHAGNAAGLIRKKSWIQIMGGTCKGRIYGGGMDYTTSELICVESGTLIQIYDGATVEDTVYGGGYYDSRYATATIQGDTNIEVYGGVLKGEIYGGCMNSDIIGNSSLKIYGGTITRDIYAGGNGTQTTAGIRNSTSVTVAGGTILGNVYGGANQRGTVAGTSDVNISGGTIGTEAAQSNVYGGGHGTSTTVSGLVNVHIGGNARINGTLYGGGEQGATNGTGITMTGGTVSGNVFAGGKQAGTAATVIDQQGGNVLGNIYGGSDNSGKISGAVAIHIAGEAANVYGGGQGSGTSAEAGTTVTILDGAIVSDSVYGGGQEGSVSGGASIQMSGGTVTGGIYGGGNQIGVTGSVVINQSGGTVEGGIYGGSNLGGSVSAPEIMVNGNAGNVYGGGYGTGTTVTSPKVTVGSTGEITGSLFGGGNMGTVTEGAILIQTGGEAANIYGGGNEAGVTGAVSITQQGGHAAHIFGGGNKAGVTGTVSIIQQGGTADNIYGGGNSAGVTGTVSIDQQGGTAGNLYGGSNSSGTVDGPSLKINGTAGSVFGGGYGGPTTTTAPVVTVGSTGEVTGSLFGGGDQGVVTGGTKIQIGDNGKAAGVYGGGNKVGVTGTVSIQVGQQAKVTNLYGGSNDSGEVDSPSILIQGLVEHAYASGYGPSTVTKTPSITADDKSVITRLYGGGELGGTENGTTVTLKSGSTALHVFGGGKNAGITGPAAITAESGSYAENIYGGSDSGGTVTQSRITVNGALGKAAQGDQAAAPGAVFGGGLGSSTSTGASSVTTGPAAVIFGEIYGGGADGPLTGNSSVILEAGGQITGNVYAGGKGQTAVITGNTEAMISAAVTGDIYGGGAQSVVKGSTQVTLKSVSRITGDVYGGGDAAAVEKQGSGDSSFGGNTGLLEEAGAQVTGNLYGGGKGSAAIVEGDTWTIAAGTTTGSIFGGGAQGAVNGSTHVDVVKGTVGDGDRDHGNVFGGSDRAKVYGDTRVHIGKSATTETGIIAANENLLVRGTVFGGGNTTDSGSTFDATDPFVIGAAEVTVDATGYASLRIEKSIFGDGNMCTVSGEKTISIKDYRALGANAGTSLQRASSLILENSEIELSGATDSANLVTTVAYSLNRIDSLTLKDGSTLKLQTPVNLVKKLESVDIHGALVTTDSTYTTGVEPGVKNVIYIQQGAQMELRTSEDVTRQGYGPVSGYMLFGSYDKDGADIKNGVYILGGFTQGDVDGGFLYAEGNPDESRVQYQKIEPTTDGKTWRNWALGKNMTRDGILVMSNKPAGQKLLDLECPWPADGSVYRMEEVRITTANASSEHFTLKSPGELKETDPAATTLSVSVSTGQTGWADQVDAGYIEGKSDQESTWRFTDTSGGKAMRTINNLSVKPTIHIELTNRAGVAVSDEEGKYPLMVQLVMRSVRVLSDGTETDNGLLTVKLQVGRLDTQNYEDILLTTGKEYSRASQSYTYATVLGKPGATITKESAITLQYAKMETSGILAGYGAQDHELSFTIDDTPSTTAVPFTLPEGVMIQAIDRSGTNPVACHYTVPPSGSTSVLLSEFVLNGTANDHYTKTFSAGALENYLFIFDFSNTPEFSQESLCVSFKQIYHNSTADEAAQPAKIVFNVADQSPKTYTINSPDKTAPDAKGEAYGRKDSLSFGLLTAADEIAAMDTTGIDCQMGAKLRLKSLDTQTYVSIPTNWLLAAGENDGRLTGKCMTVPLASRMMGINTGVTVRMADSSLPAGRYQWEINLTSSALAEYPGELHDNPIYLNFRIVDQQYSVDVDMGDGDRLYPADSSARQPLRLTVKARAAGGAAVDEVSRTVSLWKKNEGTGEYESVALDTVFANPSAFTAPVRWETAEDGYTFTETLESPLKAHVEVGTYRLKTELVKSAGTGEPAAYDLENFLIVPN